MLCEDELSPDRRWVQAARCHTSINKFGFVPNSEVNNLLTSGSTTEVYFEQDSTQSNTELVEESALTLMKEHMQCALGKYRTLRGCSRALASAYGCSQYDVQDRIIEETKSLEAIVSYGLLVLTSLEPYSFQHSAIWFNRTLGFCGWCGMLTSSLLPIRNEHYELLIQNSQSPGDWWYFEPLLVKNWILWQGVRSVEDICTRIVLSLRVCSKCHAQVKPEQKLYLTKRFQDLPRKLQLWCYKAHVHNEAHSLFASLKSIEQRALAQITPFARLTSNSQHATMPPKFQTIILTQWRHVAKMVLEEESLQKLNLSLFFNSSSYVAHYRGNLRTEVVKKALKYLIANNTYYSHHATQLSSLLKLLEMRSPKSSDSVDNEVIVEISSDDEVDDLWFGEDSFTHRQSWTPKVLSMSGNNVIRQLLENESYQNFLQSTTADPVHTDVERLAFPHFWPHGPNDNNPSFLKPLWTSHHQSLPSYCQHRLTSPLCKDTLYVFSLFQSAISHAVAMSYFQVVEKSKLTDDNNDLNHIIERLDTVDLKADTISRHPAIKHVFRKIPPFAPYCVRERLRLTSFIEVYGPPHLFITCSIQERLILQSRPDLLFLFPHLLSHFLCKDTSTSSFIRQGTSIFSLIMDFYWEDLLHLIKKKLQAKQIIVKQHWRRIEFQHRGSEHMHLLLWIDNGWVPLDKAASQGTDCFNEQLDIIHHIATNLISTKIDNAKLRKHQQHSHYDRCLTSKKLRADQHCIWNFPRLPSNSTRIVIPAPLLTPKQRYMAQVTIWKWCQELSILHTAQSNNDPTEMTYQQFLNHLKIDEDTYWETIQKSAKRVTVVPERSVRDAFTNDCLQDILEATHCNTDLQLLLTTKEAVAYLSKYVSKGEPLQADIGNIKNDNSSLLKCAEKLAERSLYRRVSLQEACLLLARRSLMSASFEVKYINVKIILNDDCKSSLSH